MYVVDKRLKQLVKVTIFQTPYSDQRSRVYLILNFKLNIIKS